MINGTPCACDLGYYCGNHTDCPICGREHDADQSESPKLCRTCRETAEAHARLARNARQHEDENEIEYARRMAGER